MLSEFSHRDVSVLTVSTYTCSNKPAVGLLNVTKSLIGYWKACLSSVEGQQFAELYISIVDSIPPLLALKGI